MRKQGYAIIGIGLAMMAGVFWLAQLNKQEETPTVAKPPRLIQETTVVQETEKPIDHFAAMRRQSSSEIEPLSEEDKAIEAEVEAYWKKVKAYEGSPRGNWMEGKKRFPEDNDPYSREQRERYKTDPAFRAISDLGNWISRQTNRRSREARDAIWEKVNRTGNFNLFQHRDLHLPNSTATIAEAKAQDAIAEIKTGWARDPEPWQEVAAFLRDRRNFSQTELNQGDPVDPNWHTDHIQWIEQIAQTIGIPLDNPEDESWIQEKIAAAEEQYYQDFNAPMVEEFKKIDEEMAAAFEAWAREPDSKEKEVATQYNQLIKQDRKRRAQHEHERRYQEEMKRNPVFKEMERERQHKERARARRAQEQAEQPPASKAE